MGWKQVNGDWYYYGTDNQPYKGWRNLGTAEGEKIPHWSFFDKNTGKLYVGWRKMGTNEGETTSHWSYFGNNGWLRTGWNLLTVKNDKEAADHWSYFGPNGWLRENWQALGKGTSNPDGDNPKHWSYFGSNGWLRTGLQYLGKGTANADGDNPKHLSYFDNRGWLITDKSITVDGKQYRADSRGWLTPLNVMTFTTFIAKRKGKASDYDGRYGAQCVDLIKFYLDEVFGIKPGSWGDAYCYYDYFYDHKELVNNFDRIANTPSFVPKKGDIIVWKKALNGAYGHIAICDGVGTTSYFYSYDQNWTGNHDACTRLYHKYDYVAGVLRPKDQSKCA